MKSTDDLVLLYKGIAVEKDYKKLIALVKETKRLREKRRTLLHPPAAN
jgi:hypothetical protein